MKKAKEQKKQRWEKKQTFLVEIDALQVEVEIFVDYSEKEIIKWSKRNTKPQFFEQTKKAIEGWDEEVKSGVDGRMCRCNGGFFVLIKPNGSWIKTFGLLVHEMTHVVQYVTRNRRIPLTEDTEEIHAYLIEHLMTSAARKML